MVAEFFQHFHISAGAAYRLEVISLPEECDRERMLPIELRYIFKHFPECRRKVRAILAEGKGIGVRTVVRTPEHILKAVHTVSVHSQHNYIVTWLPALLKDKHRPHLSDEDRKRAKTFDEDLDAAVEIILKDRLQFKKLVLIDEDNLGITESERRLMTELSELLYPLAVDYSVFRVIADNARERTAIAQNILKALLIIGPVAHVLEKFAAGVGKVFAASVDDLLGESAELMALRGSGFHWRELAARSLLLVPVFILATIGAFSVEGFIQQGRLVTGGIVFGFSAVALSLTTALQSIFMYQRNLLALVHEHKVAARPKGELFRLALIQDFTNPARFGLLLGASIAPIMGILGAVSGLMHNGWVLAAIGSTESIVAGITVLLADRINDRRFARRLKQWTRAGEPLACA